ncbi:MAG: SMP-30/gluconolactonase/LRE family protein [Thermaceae bacterium]|nr:SMP-30/gluconolactonase/LRE family protein [Thermaceae bacterium]
MCKNGRVEGVEVFDERFRALLRPDSRLLRLAGGATWSEGPVYFAEDDAVIWSDIPGNRLLRYSAREGLQEYLNPSHFQNGHYRDLQGRLIACSHGKRCVERLEPDGRWTLLADRYQGRRLNSPNDVVVRSDGTVWFTDPPYGLIQPNEGYGGTQEQEGCYVYRLEPETGALEAVITEMVKPNGLAFSPDEQILYVSETGASHDPSVPSEIRAYDVVEGRCIHGRTFALIEPGLPDGFRLDVHGYLFTSSGDSVQVYDPQGVRLGKILVPETVANLTFGGPEKNCLYITATTSLYAIYLATQGLQKP